MLPCTPARKGRIRRRLAVPRALAAVLALFFVAAQVTGGLLLGGRGPRAEASPSISQIYFTPYEAQEYLDILRAIAGNAGCCSGPLISTISITSGATGNTVVYDHFEDGYEIDPYNPVQGSTVTLAMDDGAVWTQTSSIPVDQPGRGAGFFYDGRDRIVSSAPIAVTQTAYATTPGTLHAGAVEVLDLDKSGTAFDIPVGENADYNSVFQYVGLMIVGNLRGTAVQVDADADGSFEISATLDEGETHLISGGVNLGARVAADHPVAVYVLTGDIGASYEGRDFELYPTAVWSSQLVSPVGARSANAADGTRVFLFNPGASAVVVDVETSAGPAGTVNLAARGQGSYLVPVDEGARFTARGGAPIYAFQAITTEIGSGDSTSSYDWGFSLIPVNAATTSVIVPYAPGSAGLTNNYSPVWVSTFAGTTLYVDRDGDRSTGANVDPHGDHYDFSCAVTGLRSYTIYDDGTTTCHPPSQDSAAGGDRDMTGARIYTVDNTRLVSAWGQRSSYVAGAPALDVGTTILPFPSISMAKSSSVVGDADGDGRADPGDTVAYTITMTNLGIIGVGSVLLTDEVPDYSAYVAGSTALDGVPQADDAAPYSLSPVDADSPAGGLAVGTIAAGATRTAVFRVVVDDPLPFGVGSLLNLATLTTSLGNASAVNLLPLDAGLQIEKAADPGPVDPGGTIEYTIRVFNGAPAQETGVSLADVLPAGVTFVPGSASADLSGTPVAVGVPPILVPSLTMPRGSLLTVTFRVTVNDPLPPGTSELVNTASTSSDQTPGPLTDDATTETTLGPDPVVTKSPAPGSLPEPGGTVTFTVTVSNPSAGVVTLTSLADDVFGDLLDPANPAVSANTCPAQPASIAAAGTFSCSFGTALAGSASGPGHADTVTAIVENGAGRLGTGTATAVVTFTDVPPSISVAKTPSTGSVPEPGGTVTFTVEAHNTSVEPVTLTSLADDVFGDLLDPANPAVSANTCPAQPGVLPVDGTFSCSFAAYLAGDAGDPDHVDTVSVGVVDDEGNPAGDDDEASVAFGNTDPAVDVVKGAAPGSVAEPGGTVTFTVEVANLSVEPVTFLSLMDDVFGDLLDPANPLVTGNSCPSQPLVLPAGDTLSCSFQGFVSGWFGDPDHVDTITAAVVDDEGTRVTGADDAVVAFTDVLPAVMVTKSPGVGAVPEPGGTVVFTVGVTNLSVEPVTVDALADDVFGDLLDPANPAVAANTCPAQLPEVEAGGTFSCSFEAYLAGDAAGPAHTDTVTATALDDDGNVVLGRDEAAVAFSDVPPSIGTTKTPSAGAIAEPGGVVSFLVEVKNLSAEPVTIIALADDVFGDLLDPGNALVTANNCPSQPGALPAGGVFACSFAAHLAGDAGGPDHADTVTATAADNEGNHASAAGGAVVAFSDVPPSVSVVKTPSVGAVDEPGGVVSFLVEVRNTSVEPVTLTSLADDVFGDLRFAGNPAVIGNTCPLQPAVIPVEGVLSCSFGAFVAGDAGGPPHTNTVVATVSDDEGNLASDHDDAVVAFGDVAPTIDVAKEAATGTVPEPGAVVHFDVTVHNTSPEESTVVSLLDSVFGDLLDAANPAVSANTCPAQAVAVPPGGTFACSFEALVAGDAGGPDHVDTVRAVVRDGEGNTASSADDATVAFTDVLPALSVAKAPFPGTVAEPGGAVTFSVEVENLSAEAVTLTALADDVFGDLLDRDNPALEDNTCPAQVAALPPAGALSCSFRALVAGDFGDPAHRNTVTAAADDDEGNSATASAEASVAFADALPSLAVAKSPSAGSVLEPGGMVTFSVEVANTSPEPVTLTSLADDVFGDLLDPSNAAVSANTCPAEAPLIPVDGAFACSFAAYLAGGFGDPDHVDTVTAVAADDEGNLVSGSDEAVVGFGDLSPTIEVDKISDPGRVPEPGAAVTFHLAVHNTSLEAVTLTSLADDVFGDLLDAANPLVSANTCPDGDREIPAGGQRDCSFEAFVAGDAGDPDHLDTVTATAADDEGNPVSADGMALVAFDDVLPSLWVAKAAVPSAVEEPGGIVTFVVSVENTSVEEVSLTSLADSVFGDLRDAGNAAVFANTCPAQPAAIPAGDTLDCSFEGLVAGEAGGAGHVDTVTAAAVDDEGNPASAGAAATVTIVKTDAVVAGHLFVDLDGDGAQGSGEPHLSGVHVRLVDGEGSRRTVVSGALGDWEASIPAGVVSLRVVAATVPAGYRLTTANAAQTVNAPPGSTIATADVGYQPADGSLVGKVFFDVNGDGVQGAGDPAFAGVAVALYDGGRLLGTVLTGAGGSYLFEDLAAGEYRVVVRDDADRFSGFQATLDPDGTLDGETAVLLGTSEVRTGVDFAYRGTGSVGDTVWNDADGDEAQDAAEGPIPGVVVGLVWSGFDGVLGSADDVTFPSQTTGSAGTYLFTGVPAGVIDVAADPASVDADFEPTTSISYTYGLGSGEDFLDGDIGFREQEELPYTGFEAARLGFLSLGLIALGLALLAVGRRGRRDERLRWERLQ